jgi:hypothetical protein
MLTVVGLSIANLITWTGVTVENLWMGVRHQSRSIAWLAGSDS